MPRKKAEKPEEVKKPTEKEHTIDLVQQLISASESMPMKAEKNFDEKAVLIIDYNAYALGFNEAKANIVNLLHSVLEMLEGLEEKGKEKNNE